MTDFFADLEQELRSAHPRRSRPVVPARGIGIAAAAALSLVALVLVLGSLTGDGEREAVAPPQPGWTGYGPGKDCEGSVADGTIPDALVDRFALLRGDAEPVDLPEGKVAAGAEVVRQSLRAVGEGLDGRRYVFAVARLAVEDCAPGPMGVCMISLDTDGDACGAVREAPFFTFLVVPAEGGGHQVIVLAEDTVETVLVTPVGADGGLQLRVPLGTLGTNVGFGTLPAGAPPEVTVEPETP